jgi:DNA-binding LacI/PurR family transcriptional regulator
MAALVESGVPFVVWGARPGHGEYSSVTGDNSTGGRMATEHLIAGGRRRIAMIGGPPTSPEIAERRAGYEAALQAAGLEVDPALIEHIPWTDPDTGAAEAVDRLLERAPDLDAIFAHSDRWALVALSELRERGIEVPGRVAVVGYDDIAIAAHASPPLTTVRQDGDLVGQLLARALVQQLETGALTNVTIPAELVVRESA